MIITSCTIWYAISCNGWKSLGHIVVYGNAIAVLSNRLTYWDELCNLSEFLLIKIQCICLFVCLFVCSHSRIFTHMETSPYQWRAANFDLYSTLMAIEQWGIFNVPHLLWYEAPVYNGHLPGPVTLTPVVECLAVDVSLPVLTTKVWRDWN